MLTSLSLNTLIITTIALIMLLLAIFDIFIIKIFNKHSSPITHKLLIYATSIAFITTLIFTIIQLLSIKLSIFIAHFALFTYFTCKCCLWLFSRERAKICLINGKSTSSATNEKIIKYSIVSLIISMIIIIITMSLSILNYYIKSSILSALNLNVIFLIYIPIMINIINEFTFNLLIFYLFTVEIQKAESIVANHVSTFNKTNSLNQTLKKNIFVVSLQIISSIVCCIILLYLSLFNKHEISSIVIIFCNDYIIQISLCFSLFHGQRKQAIYNMLHREEIRKMRLKQLKNDKLERCSRGFEKQKSHSIIYHDRYPSQTVSISTQDTIKPGVYINYFFF